MRLGWLAQAAFEFLGTDWVASAAEAAPPRTFSTAPFSGLRGPCRVCGCFVFGGYSWKREVSPLRILFRCAEEDAPVEMTMARRLFRFGGFAVHYVGPLGAVLRHLEGEVVGGGRSDLHGEAAFHGLAAHFFVAGPGPGFAFEGALGFHELSPAIELAVVEAFVVGVVAHDGETGTVAHGASEISVADEEKVSVHPFAAFIFGHGATRPHGAGLHVAGERPGTDEVL